MRAMCFIVGITQVLTSIAVLESPHVAVWMPVLSLLVGIGMVLIAVLDRFEEVL